MRSTTVRSTRIAGFGHHAPERRIENSELERDLGLTPGWIERRTGIRARHWAAPDLALKAARTALDKSEIMADEIGLVLLATSTPDHPLPPSAPLLAHRLGLSCGAVDLTGACAGFLYAFLFADGFVKSTGRSVLIVAANILSRRIDAADRTTGVLFADAAGAVVLSPSSQDDAGILGSDVRSAGRFYDQILVPIGGTRNSQETSPNDRCIKIKDGKLVFEQAVKLMTLSSRSALKQAKVNVSQIDHFIPHQANTRIFDLVAQNLAFNPSITLRSIEEFGNSSAATIPLTLSLADEARRFESGDILLITAVGAGFTGGAIVFRATDQ